MILIAIPINPDWYNLTFDLRGGNFPRCHSESRLSSTIFLCPFFVGYNSSISSSMPSRLVPDLEK